MTVEEQLERDILDYGPVATRPGRHLNKYIYDRAVTELAKLRAPKQSVKKTRVVKAKPTFQEYKDKTLSQLRVIGKALSIPKYYNMNEDKLITEIMKRH